MMMMMMMMIKQVQRSTILTKFSIYHNWTTLDVPSSSNQAREKCKPGHHVGACPHNLRWRGAVAGVTGVPVPPCLARTIPACGILSEKQ